MNYLPNLEQKDEFVVFGNIKKPLQKQWLSIDNKTIILFLTVFLPKYEAN